MVTDSSMSAILAPLSTVFRRPEEPQFHRFGDLPEEVRFGIWLYALAEAHVPAVLWRYSGSETPYHFYGHSNSDQVRNIAQSCNEARRIAERCFTPIHLRERVYSSHDLVTLAHGAVRWVSGSLTPWLSSPVTSTRPRASHLIDLTSSYFILHLNTMDMVYYLEKARAKGTSPAVHYINDRVPVEVRDQVRVIWFHFYNVDFMSKGIEFLLESCPNLRRLELSKFGDRPDEEAGFHRRFTALQENMLGWKLRKVHKWFGLRAVECRKGKREVHVTSVPWDIKSDEDQPGALEKFVNGGIFRRKPDGTFYTPSSVIEPAPSKKFWDWYFEPLTPLMKKIPNVELHNATREEDPPAPGLGYYSNPY